MEPATPPGHGGHWVQSPVPHGEHCSGQLGSGTREAPLGAARGIGVWRGPRPRAVSWGELRTSSARPAALTLGKHATGQVRTIKEVTPH